MKKEKLKKVRDNIDRAWSLNDSVCYDLKRLNEKRLLKKCQKRNMSFLEDSQKIKEKLKNN